MGITDPQAHKYVLKAIQTFKQQHQPPQPQQYQQHHSPFASPSVVRPIMKIFGGTSSPHPSSNNQPTTTNTIFKIPGFHSPATPTHNNNNNHFINNSNSYQNISNNNNPIANNHNSNTDRLSLNRSGSLATEAMKNFIDDEIAKASQRNSTYLGK